MPLEVQCEQCQKRYRVNESLAGRKVRCKWCGSAMRVPDPPASASSFDEVPQGALREEEEDEVVAVAPPPLPSPPPTAAPRSYARPTPVTVYAPVVKKKRGANHSGAVGGAVGISGLGLLILLLKFGRLGAALYRAFNPQASTPPASPPQVTYDAPAQEPRPAPPPDWSNVPKVNSADLKPALAPSTPKERQTPDGKPVPPPPVETAEDDLHPTFADEATLPFRHGGRAPKEAAAAGPAEKKPEGPPSVLTMAPTEGDVLADAEALKAPPPATPFVFVRAHGGGEGVWQRYETAGAASEWKVTGQIALSSGGGFEQPIVSPNGEYLVRAGFGFDPTIEVYSFSQGKLTHTINGKGMTHFVGFLNDDQFIVAGGRDRPMMAFVSAKTGQKLRDLISPVGMKFEGNEASVSSDATKIAVPVQSDGGPVLLIYSAGGSILQKIPLPTGSDPTPAPVGPAGRRFGPPHGFGKPLASAFSNDGKRVAVMGEVAMERNLYVCDLPGAKVLAWHQYPHLDFSLPPFWSGVPAMRWLADTDCVLLRDSVAVDTVTGRTVGQTALRIEFFHEIAPDTYLLNSGPTGRRTQLCKLDRDALREQLKAARAAGPIASGNPAAVAVTSGTSDAGARTVKFAASGIVPKKGDAKVGGSPDPAPKLDAAVVTTPIAIEAPYSQIRDVEFGRSAKPVAVVWAGPTNDYGRSEVAEDGVLLRVDLAAGKAASPVHVSPEVKLLAINGDATAAVISADGGDAPFRMPNTRVDVVSISGPNAGRATASFLPYADLKGAGGGSSVSWAAMPDDDGVLTLNGPKDKNDAHGSRVLVRWSLAAHKAVWARDDVYDQPVLSPAGKQLFARQGQSALLLDAKTGEAVGALNPVPLAGTQVTHAAFSPDGVWFVAASSQGVMRWDVRSGGSGIQRLTDDPSVAGVEACGERFVLAGDQLFDAEKSKPIFTYPVYGGRHVYGDFAGRHWYLARSAGDGAPYLCSTVTPSDHDQGLADEIEAHPPLIRPGKQVALQVSAGPASGKITEALAAKLKARHLDQGEVVATLRVSAQQRQDADEVRVTEGNSAFTQRETGERVHAVDYDCFFELVDAQGKVLYGSPQTVVFREMRNGVVMLKKGQSMQNAVDEQLQRQIESWGSGVFVPTYLTAEGKPSARPQRVLKVDLIGGQGAPTP